MQFASIRVELAGGVARIIFADAARGNPIDARFCENIAEIANRLTSDAAVRAILLSAEGRAFSVGGDIRSFGEDEGCWPLDIKRWTTTFHNAVARFQRGDAPMVAAVHGACAGGMAALVAGCDLVIAARSASFVAAYAGIGFSCDGGASVMMSRRMGLARARRFYLLNESLDAEAALAAGLADELVDDAALEPRALEAAAKIAAGPTRSYGEIRRLMLSAAEQPLETQLELEAQGLARAIATDDAREGLAAFRERRAPVFTGR